MTVSNTYLFFDHLILKYNSLEFGLYVDKHGDPCRTIGTIEWEGTAERVAFHAPYILLFDSRFIEIRHVETGRLVQIISGSDVRCIWDGRGVSTSAVSPEHEHGDDSQEARVHVVMNATDSTSGPGPLKNKSIMQHVCELIPTVQLFTSDTNSTTGTGQDGAQAPSNMGYSFTPRTSANPGTYAPSVSSAFPSPASGHATSTNAYAPSPTAYVPVYPSSNNVHQSSNNLATSTHPNAANPYVSPIQSYSSIDLSTRNSGGASGAFVSRGGGSAGYF